MKLRYILSFFSLFAVSAATHAESFSEEQKTEIGQVVHQYLLDNPSLLIEVSEKLQAMQQEVAQAQAQEAVSNNIDNLFFSNNEIVLGNPEGSINLVEFLDYRCGYCQHAVEIVEALKEANPELRVVLKVFPIRGEQSQISAEAILAANQQADAETVNKLHQAFFEIEELTIDSVSAAAAELGLDVEKLKTDMQTDAVKQQLQETFNVFREMGLSGTPSFIVAKNTNVADELDAVVIPGLVSQEDLQSVIDQLKNG